MSYLLKYSQWRSIFEATTQDTAALQKQDSELAPNLQKVVADPGKIKTAISAMFYDSTNKLKDTGKKDTAATISEILTSVPDFAQAIIDKYQLKNMLEFYSKCGYITMTPGYPVKNIPIIGGSVILYDQRAGYEKATLFSKPKAEFENWISAQNLARWKAGNSSILISDNDNYRTSIKISIGVKKGTGVDFETPAYKTWKNTKGKELNTYITLNRKGKQIALNTDNFGEGADAITKILANEFKLDELTDIVKLFNVEMPSMYYAGEETDQFKNSYFTYLFSGEEKTVTKTLKADTEEKITTIIPGEVKPIEKTIGADFDSGKFNLTKDMLKEIDGIVEAIKTNVEGKENPKFSEIRVISSASNAWTDGKAVSASHTNKGEKIESFKMNRTEDPAPGKEIAQISELALKNQKLAWLRGTTFAEKLMEVLRADSELSNVTFPENATIEWRITDTGGHFDKSPDKDKSYDKPGQYVRVKITGETKEKDTTITDVTVKPGVKGKYPTVPAKRYGIWFQPSPGVTVVHPNSKLDFLNRLGLTNKTPEMVQKFAQDKGAAALTPPANQQGQTK